MFKNKKTIWISFIVLALALGGGGYFAYTTYFQPIEAVAAEATEVQTAVASTGDDARKLTHLGLELVRRGYTSEAELAVDRAMRLEPDNPTTLSTAGRVYAVVGHLDKAQTTFKRARRTRAELADSRRWWWETGWWTAGPFASELTAEDTPQSSRGPIHELVTADRAQRPSTDPVDWITVPVL